MSKLDKEFEILKKYQHLIDAKAITLIIKFNIVLMLVAGIYFKSFSLAIYGILTMPTIIAMVVVFLIIYPAYKKDKNNESSD